MVRFSINSKTLFLKFVEESESELRGYIAQNSKGHNEPSVEKIVNRRIEEFSTESFKIPDEAKELYIQGFQMLLQGNRTMRK